MEVGLWQGQYRYVLNLGLGVIAAAVVDGQADGVIAGAGVGVRWVRVCAVAAIAEVPVPAIVSTCGVIEEVNLYTGTGVGVAGMEVGLWQGQYRDFYAVAVGAVVIIGHGEGISTRRTDGGVLGIRMILRSCPVVGIR